jgi:hypothetical protein
MKTKIIILLSFVLLTTEAFPQNPNFHIYLCFGQSNMEGQGTIEKQDKIMDSRFKVLQAIDCPGLGRTKNNWYSATPPLCQCWSGLSPADYFGRTMVANLPDSITVGVINVAIGGCDIRLFDKNIYQNYTSTYKESWFVDKVKAYNGNPYEYLVNLGKLAQKDGVIKGILLHQGETNTGNVEWPSYVDTIYKNLMADLSLNPNSVPLLAGEVVNADQGGTCASMNPIINELPKTIPTAHVISSSGCSDASDNVHFNAAGYRKLGTRYAVKMLSLLGYESVYLETECGTLTDKCIVKADTEASNGSAVTSSVGAKNITNETIKEAGVVEMKFTVSTNTNYYVYGRFNNPTTENDSFWLRIDNEPFELIDGLTTTGWQWKVIKNYKLKKGKHTISIAFGESGSMLDKLVIKNSQISPVNFGEEANKICVPKF